MKLSLLVTLQFFFTFLFSQDNVQLSLFDTLYKEKNILVRLTYPFDSLYRANNEEIDALVSISSDSGCLMKEAPLTLNLRGKFRRMKCTMPPLLLNFKKSTLKGLNLSTIDEIKLVTHCIEGEEGHQNLEEERLIYELYETLTPFSYRTIWLKVEYCNMTNPSECISSVGFFLEPDKVISSRLGMIERKMFNMDEDSLHFNSYALTTAFNFLIGNRDWSIISSRNAKLFYNPDSGKYVVIPYDFDYSNIVGAKYRRETLSAEMTHPFDRIYFGEYFQNQSGHILKSFYGFQKSLIDAVNTSNNPIDAERRKRICKYLDHWFDMVKRSRPESLPYGTVCPYKGGL